MKTVFILFETNLNDNSKIFVGAFSSYDFAYYYAVAKRIISTVSNAEILETNLDNPKN